MIRISGYIAAEKIAIVRRYLEPQSQKLTGVPADGIEITDDAMYTLITEYARYMLNTLSVSMSVCVGA